MDNANASRAISHASFLRSSTFRDLGDIHLQPGALQMARVLQRGELLYFFRQLYLQPEFLLSGQAIIRVFDQ